LRTIKKQRVVSKRQQNAVVIKAAMEQKKRFVAAALSVCHQLMTKTGLRNIFDGTKRTRGYVNASGLAFYKDRLLADVISQ
jgi:hypothetical protein